MTESADNELHANADDALSRSQSGPQDADSVRSGSQKSTATTIQLPPVTLTPAEKEEVKEVNAAVQKEVDEVNEPWFNKIGEAGITVGLVAMILVLRLFAVSDWEWGVAASLSESFSIDDALSIVLGTLFERPQLSGVILSVALPFALFREYWLRKHGLTKTRANNWFTIVILIAVSYVLLRTFHMWWTAAISLALLVLLFAAGPISKRFNLHVSLAKVGTHVGILVGVALLVIASAIDTPWVENERIETTSGVVEGYVLDASPGFLKVMTDDREILILTDSEVTSRTILEDEH